MDPAGHCTPPGPPRSLQRSSRQPCTARRPGRAARRRRVRPDQPLVRADPAPTPPCLVAPPPSSSQFRRSPCRPPSASAGATEKSQRDVQRRGHDVRQRRLYRAAVHHLEQHRREGYNPLIYKLSGTPDVVHGEDELPALTE